MKRSSPTLKCFAVLGMLAFGLTAGASAQHLSPIRTESHHGGRIPAPLFPAPAQTSCVPAPSGLVGWWQGEGNGHDSISGNNATVPGGVTFVPAKVGQGFSFNNSNVDVKIPASSNLNVGSSAGFTLEAWISPADVSQRHPLFEWNVGDGTTYWGVHFYIDPDSFDAGPGALYANIVDDSGAWHQLHTGAGVVTNNVFQHVALTYDKASGLATIYCNGVTISQQYLGSFTPLTTYDLHLGDRPLTQGETYLFTGLLDEASVYNRALSAAEIQAIYSAGSAGKCSPITPPACVPPPAGLISWWQAENNANDSVSGNNGTLLNGTSFTSGEVGQAFSLGGGADGSASPCVQIPYSPGLITSNYSIEAWIKPLGQVTNAPQNQSWVFGQNRGRQLVVQPGTTGVNVAFYFSSDHGVTWYGVFSTNEIPLNQFTHVAGTWDGTKLRLYINGVLNSSSAPVATPSDSGCEFFIGGTCHPAADDCETVGQFFNGLIDEVSYYNRALSNAEIQSICIAGSAGKCAVPPPPGPVVPAISGFTPASGTNGTVVTISGNNFNPTAALNIVYFGAVRATVLSASPTSLVVTVPVGATYAPVTVTVNGLTACSEVPFLPTFHGTGAGSPLPLAPRLDLPTSDGPAFTAVADFNGDGQPDLLVASYGGLSVYQNISSNGALTAASFAPEVDLPVPTGVDAMIVADVDGDGRLDVVLLNRILNQAMILKNLSASGMITTNSFAVPVAFSTGADPRGVAVRDLDGDGKPELIVGNWGDSTVSVFQNIGQPGSIESNSFAPAVVFATGASPQGLAVADLDGDGRPDVVTANNNYNYGTDDFVSLLRNTSSPGNISFAPHVGLAGLPSSYGLVIGDLDGDGKPDLAVSSFDGGQAVSVYRNTSTPGDLTIGSFAPHVDFDAGGWGNALAIGDLDGDGRPDLAVVTQLPDHLSVFLNISAPGSFTTDSFAPRVDYPAGWNPNGVVIGDLDGDARPDIAFAVSYGATLSIYQNQSPFNGPPLITSQPASQTTVQGSNVVLSVIVTGGGPFSYQWTFNGTNISGATNDTLNLADLHPNQSGTYAVTIITPYGTTTSSGAIVTVITQNLLIYKYVGAEKVTTAGQAFAFAYSGQMFFIPDTTNGTFVGWGKIKGKKQYWVNSLSGYLWITIPGPTNHTYTILGQAGQEIDTNGYPHIWSNLHKGHNTQLTIGTHKYFSFPDNLFCDATRVRPDSQTGNPILSESSSVYTFAPQMTQAANNTGQNLVDLVNDLTQSLESQGYQKQ